MTFVERETSRSMGEPNTLLRFIVGSTVYGYTDAEEPVTWNSVTYQPVPVDRDAVNSSGTLDKSSLKITLPTNVAVAELFRVFPPSIVVTVTMFQGHADDPDEQYTAIWSGRVLSCSRANSKVTLGCEPVSTSMRRPGLRRRYQRGCPHVLYGDRCRAAQSSFTSTTSVEAVAGAWVTLAPGWNGSLAAEKFINGIFMWATTGHTEIRAILRVDVSNRRLLLGGPVGGMGAGASVSMALGCAHNMDDCRDVFGNIHNFGGMPWIPTKNPIGNDNQFY